MQFHNKTTAKMTAFHWQYELLKPMKSPKAFIFFEQNLAQRMKFIWCQIVLKIKCKKGYETYTVYPLCMHTIVWNCYGHSKSYMSN